MIQFGAGDLIATPTGGVLPGNPTPILFGTLQDISVEISFSKKELWGKKSFPVAIARTEGKITCKAKSANIYAKVLNDFFFGSTVVAGENYSVIDERDTPASNAIVVVHATGFVSDQGVRYASTQAPLAKTASAPAAGQYSVNVGTGTYTFNAADTGAMLVSYIYTPVSTPGFSTTLTNPAMGSQPEFSVVLSNSQFQAKRLLIQFNRCISDKLTLNFKNQDFMVPDFDFAAFADAADNIGTIGLDE